MLHFIRQAGTLTLTLEEINDVLDLQRRGQQSCERVTGILDAHIARIDRKPADLRRLHRSLPTARRAAARRGGHDAVVCQIIEYTPAESIRA
ncbi:MerR family DNA-binding protein [Pseudonocardia oceani]|uniref:MerR family DNA-binding protein n=1 Tax=Pseudonocardia oceani TaxID=2792013 RepID=UPI001CF6880B|nr:MerR family DNA-binding protein [Pseudonocardia oceani]